MCPFFPVTFGRTPGFLFCGPRPKSYTVTVTVHGDRIRTWSSVYHRHWPRPWLTVSVTLGGHVSFSKKVTSDIYIYIHWFVCNSTQMSYMIRTIAYQDDPVSSIDCVRCSRLSCLYCKPPNTRVLPFNYSSGATDGFFRLCAPPKSRKLQQSSDDPDIYQVSTVVGRQLILKDEEHARRLVVCVCVSV